MLHHEPWADEAHSWLVARDSGWLRIIFSELRMEGHPGLWYTILWIAIHWFHASYSALGWIGLAGAVSGASVVIYLAPFPRSLRYLMVLSFYFLYQYVVVARPYTLLPLFTFLAAWFYRQPICRVLQFTVALMFLSWVTIHGTIIAIALAAGYGGHAYREGAFRDSNLRVRLIFATFLFLTSLVCLVLLLWPPSGSLAVDEARTFSLSQHLARALAAIAAAFCNFIPLSLVIAALLYLWSKARKVRVIWLIAVIGNALAFGFLRGAPHHLGTMVVGSVVALWCGWPTSDQAMAFSSGGQRWYRVSIVALCLLFAYQSWWSWTAIRSDWLFPYSGAQEAAEFLKSNGADKQSIEGFDYKVTAILPYFESNIFTNLQVRGEPVFLHSFSVEFRGRATLSGTTRIESSWVVVGTDGKDQAKAIEYLSNAGYALVHVADGTAFSQADFLNEKQTYLIFRRNRQWGRTGDKIAGATSGAQ